HAQLINASSIPPRAIAQASSLLSPLTASATTPTTIGSRIVKPYEWQPGPSLLYLNDTTRPPLGPGFHVPSASTYRSAVLVRHVGVRLAAVRLVRLNVEPPPRIR